MTKAKSKIRNTTATMGMVHHGPDVSWNCTGARKIASQNSTMSRISANRPSERISQLPKKTTSTGRTYQCTAVSTIEKISSDGTSARSDLTLGTTSSPKRWMFVVAASTRTSTSTSTSATKSTTDW